VAFDWNGEKQDNYDIYVKLVSGGSPLRLTTNPAEDTFPAWSPDGSQIAFVRTGAGIYLISPLGGQERRLTDANANSLTWMPDGKSLLASIQAKDISFRVESLDMNASPYVIFQVSMGGEMRKVSPPATGQYADLLPAVSPDGLTLAFGRYVNGSDLYVSPVTGGEARRLTNDLRRFTYGQVWINNREILFSSNRAGGWTLWRIAADGRSEPQPVPGVDGDARYPAIAYPAKSLPRVAYQRTAFDSNIWRTEVSLPENGPARTITAPAPVIASTRLDGTPQFSPDSKRIVFTSDRSGYLEIWAANSDGSNVTQLTTLVGARNSSPRWAPDGQKIVFDSLASGNNDIWMVSAEGGSPKQLTMETSNDARPSWSRDGRWIYFRSNRSGATQIWKIPSAEPYKPAVQVTQNGAYDAIESVDGKLLYFTKVAKGLWSLPVVGGDETPVLESILPGSWDVTDKGVYFVSSQVIQFLSFANRKLTRICEVAKPLTTTAPYFSVTRDGRWIAWAQIDHEDSDLMLLENFR
jgi:Tol biopolymer transport system component